MGKILSFLRWTSDARDNPTWANFGKQNWRWHLLLCDFVCDVAFCVAFGVVFGVRYVWCLVRGMCGVVWRAEKPPCVHPGRARVCIQKFSVCTSTTRTCSHTNARRARTHGDVLNVHTGACRNPHTSFTTFFQRAATHHTNHVHQTTTNNTHNTTQHHTETETERQREDKERRQRKREKGRRKKRDKTKKQKKTNQETKGEDEKEIERQDKRKGDEREKKREDEKEKQEREDEKENEGQDEKENERQEKKRKMKEKMKDMTRRDKIKSSRENKARQRWKEMKETMFFWCLRTLKPARWTSPKNVSEKILRRTSYSSIFLRKFRIWPCFQLFTWFKFDFRVGWINSEWVSARTILCRGRIFENTLIERCMGTKD